MPLSLFSSIGFEAAELTFGAGTVLMVCLRQALREIKLSCHFESLGFLELCGVHLSVVESVCV